jgi:lipopolysaccharide export LptBFGC system permease protein LptF
MRRVSWTLQRYIFVEMAKTFALTAIGLTGVFLLGGGVLNMVKIGDVTPGQLVSLLMILLPLAGAFTVPVAALFSAASTYGRISADNEFVACRSSGINIHTLLLPALAVSVVSAASSFALLNFVIPGMVQHLNSLVSADVTKIIEQRLSRPKGMALRDGTLRLCADQWRVAADVDENSVDLGGVVFVEVDEESWTRFGTVQRVNFSYERGEDQVGVTGRLIGVSFFDRRTGDFGELAEWDIPRNEFPLALPNQLKYLDLWTLLQYRDRPTEWREVREELEALRFEVARLATYDGLWAEWTRDGAITLSAAGHDYTMRAGAAERMARDGAIEMTDVTVEDVDRSGGRGRGGGRTLRANRAALEMTPADAERSATIEVRLFVVNVSEGGEQLTKAQETLGPFAPPAELIAAAEQADVDRLMSPSSSFNTSPTVDRQRAAAEQRLGGTLRTIASVLHERASFSVSICVLVLLAAALGIILRGSHVLVAFGISVLPLVVIIIAILAGKQLARAPDKHLIGLLVIWSGLGLAVLVDGWTLFKLLRR